MEHEDPPRCDRCGLGNRELSDADVCTECLEEAKHIRQLISDYYAGR